MSLPVNRVFINLSVLLIISLSAIACSQSTKNKKKEKNTVPQRALTKKELSEKTLYELRLLRNEIFARRGYEFQSKDLKKHFSQFKWYQPKHTDVNDELSAIDKQNINLILSLEKKRRNIPFDELIKGTWINIKYHKALTETKSAKKAQNAAYLTAVIINEQVAHLVYNLHEGVTRDYRLEGNKAKMFKETATRDRFNRLVITHDEYGTDTLFKVDNGTINFENYIGEVLFKGNYKNVETGKILSFESNGKVSGMFPWNKYNVRIDYFDMALDIDLIEFSSDLEQIRLTWEFSEDTLKLFKVNCVKWHETTGDCMKISKGEAVNQYIKIPE